MFVVNKECCTDSNNLCPKCRSNRGGGLPLTPPVFPTRNEDASEFVVQQNAAGCDYLPLPPSLESVLNAELHPKKKIPTSDGQTDFITSIIETEESQYDQEAGNIKRAIEFVDGDVEAEQRRRLNLNDDGFDKNDILPLPTMAW